MKLTLPALMVTGFLHLASGPVSAQEPRLLTALGAGHAGGVLGVTFSPDGKRLASCGADKTIKVWDVGSRKQIATLKGHTQAVACIAFSPDGKLLASTSGEKAIRLWDMTTFREKAILKGEQQAGCLAFSPDGKTLASGGARPVVQLWEVATGKQTAALTHRENKGAACVAFSPDGKTLAAGGGALSGWAQVWDVASGKAFPPQFGQVQLVQSLAFSPTSKLLAVADAGNAEIEVLEVNQFEKLPRSISTRPDVCICVAFSPDGQVLATGCGHQTVVKAPHPPSCVILWEVSTGKRLATLAGHTAKVTSVAFSPDGKLLASASQDGSLRLWQLPAGK